MSKVGLSIDHSDPYPTTPAVMYFSHQPVEDIVDGGNDRFDKQITLF